MAKRKEDPRITKLKEEGKTVYSISRLNTFNQCEYEYYITYILGNRGQDNCYSIAGTKMHDHLESIHNGESTEEEMKNDFENMLIEFELNGIEFPTSNIKANWVKDMRHFVNHFEKIDRKAVTEPLVLYQLDNGIWLQGYIDAIFPDDDGNLVIIDWKSSSEFTGKRLTEAGRQLLIYKKALESQTSKKVSKVGWFMMKYVNVVWDNKIKMYPRRNWVEKIKNELAKDLAYEDEFVAELLIDRAIGENSLDSLPEYIQQKYKTEPAIVWYEVTSKKMQECEDYIKDTVKRIESKGENEEEYDNVSKNKFYCNNLCNHRDVCKYRKIE